MSGPISLRDVASLDLLRGFVAVGRRLNITQAAVDLGLSQPALSRQVQSLEQSLGVRLFQRGHRSLVFTAEGAQLFAVADDALAQLQAACADLRGLRPPVVSVLSCIGFASLWLQPRLGSFQAAHPGIDVRITAHGQPRDAAAEADLTIRYCTEQAAPAGAERLFDDEIVPVAHPALVEGTHNLEALIAANTLLDFDNPRYPWLQWADFLAALAPPPRPRATLRFNQYNQVIQAALAGQGIALGRRALVAPWLAEGKLCAVGAEGAARPSAYAYWLLCAGRAKAPAQHLAAWIRHQAATDAQGD